MCCDDAYHVTPRVSALVGCDNLMREIRSVRDMFMYEIMKIWMEFKEEISTLYQIIEDLQADVALCKRCLASGGGNTNYRPKLDVPKPSPFMGKWETRTVDDFLWEMEQYLEGVNVEILKLSDQDSLFYFLDGLQGWAKTKLERREVQDLATAIAHAEALIDF
ncbi:hypothetical protein Tco_1234025 [Tanacetum coccineum]